jgi:hypothetical protein
VTAGLGVAGLYVGQSVRRKTRAEIESQVAERRLEAYGALWEKTKDATPMRLRTSRGPLTDKERRALHDELTHWYYSGGYGMVLSEDTRNIYLTVKENLVCALEDLEPESLYESARKADPAEQETIRGTASIRQLSLLRTSIRADLLVYTGPWGQKLTKADRLFLKACGVRQWRRPWRPSLRGRRAVEKDEPILAARRGVSQSDEEPHAR